MKLLWPVDSSKASLAPMPFIQSLARRGDLEVLVLNVQPRFHRHIARFTSKESLDSIRAERSAAAMSGAIEALSRAGVPFRAMSDVGMPSERIAAVADREGVDEILFGTGRHPSWLRWVNPSIAQGVMNRTDIPVTVFARGKAGWLERLALPAGIAGAALLLAAD
jgi:nucleotide-binding universal stress UspA family protein